jgi:hypothetical protein
MLALVFGSMAAPRQQTYRLPGFGVSTAELQRTLVLPLLWRSKALHGQPLTGAPARIRQVLLFRDSLLGLEHRDAVRTLSAAYSHKLGPGLHRQGVYVWVQRCMTVFLQTPTQLTEQAATGRAWLCLQSPEHRQALHVPTT